MGIFGYLLGRAEGNMDGENTGRLTDYNPQEYARQQVGGTKSRKIKPDSDRETGYDQGFTEAARRGRGKRR